MNRRHWLMMIGAGTIAARNGVAAPSLASQAEPQVNPSPAAGVTPDKLLLKDYHPASIYRIPKTDVQKAKFPIIDAHCHGGRTPDRISEMVRIMDDVGVEKTVIFTGARNGETFAKARELYSKYTNRFDLWCGFDMTGANDAGFRERAVKALEECHSAGAVGVGEILDKGRGFGVSVGTGYRPSRSNDVPPHGPHPDDPRMDPLFEACARFGMPVNIHISDPIWSYQKMDYTNDGLYNGFRWRLDDKPDIMGHEDLLETFERMVKKHPKTTFIACHLANLDYNLTRLGQMFEKYPNLYADMSARLGETATIPRFVLKFYQKYPDRVLYGTDFDYTAEQFRGDFRILETEDEHFYQGHAYHWPLYGFGLPEDVLRKLYRENALKVFQKARSQAS